MILKTWLNDLPTELPASNGRFGAMAAVSPQTILCEIARYYPAGSSVEAATAPSRWDVVGNRRKQQRNLQAKKGQFLGLRTKQSSRTEKWDYEMKN